jgi:hypothetical protein
MPIQRGRATRKTTIEARKSWANVLRFSGDGGDVEGGPATESLLAAEDVTDLSAEASFVDKFDVCI